MHCLHVFHHKKTRINTNIVLSLLSGPFDPEQYNVMLALIKLFRPITLDLGVLRWIPCRNHNILPYYRWV